MKTEKSIERIFLHPDEIAFGLRNTNVTTILGSCVSITVFCPEKQIGAICHASLPKCPDLVLNINLNTEILSKYVDGSIHRLYNWIERKCTNPRTIEVKIFGGTNHFIKSSNDTIFDIGKQNIDTAMETLKKFDIKPKVIDVGGQNGRKIIFNTQDGSVLLKRLN